MINYEELEEYDKNKTKVFKFVVYKNRSENEIRRKFENSISSEMLDNIIEDLKENGYIDDNQYIQRAVNEFIALKNLSLKQIKYKLLSKGIDSNLVDEYFFQNKEELQEYEIKSAQNLINKKCDTSAEEIIQSLLKKGFEYDNVKEAIERCNEWKTL